MKPKAIIQHLSATTMGMYNKYQEWKTNPKNPKGFDGGKRFDGGMKNGSPGASHTNKKTGEEIPTPHVQEKGKDPRRPLPWEIPSNFKF